MYGIVTFHDGINFGAYLQVYALQQYLTSKGIDNEIINYKSRRHWFNEYKFFLHTKRPRLLVNNIYKIYKFKQEQRRFKQTQFFTNPKVAKQKHYQAIVFGSDEIWNFNNALSGKDLFYFGKGLMADNFIAYSTSFGNITSGTVIDNDIRELLLKFTSISVRDENSVNMLKNIYPKSVPITLDPTLLYDFSNLERKCPYSNFIMVYSTGFNADIQRQVRSYADSKNMKLISVGWWNQFCDINVIAIDPFEFLSYFRRAAEVVTSMYHGVLFSLKYHKRFSLIIDPYRVNKLSIINRLKLSDRIYNAEGSLDKTMNEKIDYPQVEAFLLEDRLKSEEYLLTALKG